MLVELLKIGGVTALLVGVMYLLYNKILELGIFKKLNQRQTFNLIVILATFVWTAVMFTLASTGGVDFSVFNMGDISNSDVIINQGQG